MARDWRELDLLSMVVEVCRRDLQCLLTSKVFDVGRTRVAEVVCYRINGWMGGCSSELQASAAMADSGVAACCCATVIVCERAWPILPVPTSKQPLRLSNSMGCESRICSSSLLLYRIQCGTDVVKACQRGTILGRWVKGQRTQLPRLSTSL